MKIPFNTKMSDSGDFLSLLRQRRSHLIHYQQLNMWISEWLENGCQLWTELPRYKKNTRYLDISHPNRRNDSKVDRKTAQGRALNFKGKLPIHQQRLHEQLIRTARESVSSKKCTPVKVDGTPIELSPQQPSREEFTIADNGSHNLGHVMHTRSFQPVQCGFDNTVCHKTLSRHSIPFSSKNHYTEESSSNWLSHLNNTDNMNELVIDAMENSQETNSIVSSSVWRNAEESTSAGISSCSKNEVVRQRNKKKQTRFMLPHEKREKSQISIGNSEMKMTTEQCKRQLKEHNEFEKYPEQFSGPNKRINSSSMHFNRWIKQDPSGSKRSSFQEEKTITGTDRTLNSTSTIRESLDSENTTRIDGNKHSMVGEDGFLHSHLFTLQKTNSEGKFKSICVSNSRYTNNNNQNNNNHNNNSLKVDYINKIARKLFGVFQKWVITNCETDQIPDTHQVWLQVNNKITEQNALPFARLEDFESFSESISLNSQLCDGKAKPEDNTSDTFILSAASEFLHSTSDEQFAFKKKPRPGIATGRRTGTMVEVASVVENVKQTTKSHEQKKGKSENEGTEEKIIEIKNVPLEISDQTPGFDLDDTTDVNDTLDIDSIPSYSDVWDADAMREGKDTDDYVHFEMKNKNIKLKQKQSKHRKHYRRTQSKRQRHHVSPSLAERPPWNFSTRNLAKQYSDIIPIDSLLWPNGRKPDPNLIPPFWIRFNRHTKSPTQKI